ncbi:MAG TPA: heme o synthase [Candidatus Acidoferrum sp.]|nr:heme o synthase [Candidatus Acidoferrum sp.]
MTFLPSLRDYIEVTKPKTVALLAFTSVATMAIVALSQKWFMPLLILASLTAIIMATAGCNTVTCYIDRDIDAIMRRTSNRPIPTGRIAPPERALVWGLFLIAIGLLLGLWINIVSFTILFLGVLDNVVVYSLLLKRRNPVNIILGGFSGGLPAMFGWSTVTGTVNVLSILLAGLVVLWIPSHIWSLAIFSREDYARAGVPMLPVVMEEKAALRCIVATVILMIPFSLLVYWVGGFGWIYAVSASVLGTIMLLLNVYLFVRPTRENAYRAFKISSPYLFLIFLSMVIDRVLV